MRIVTARAFHLALAKRHVREAKLLTRALRMALRTGSEDSRFAQADAVDWPVHYRVAIGAGKFIDDGLAACGDAPFQFRRILVDYLSFRS